MIMIVISFYVTFTCLEDRKVAEFQSLVYLLHKLSMLVYCRVSTMYGCGTGNNDVFSVKSYYEN